MEGKALYIATVTGKLAYINTKDDTMLFLTEDRKWVHFANDSRILRLSTERLHKLADALNLAVQFIDIPHPRG